MKIQPLHDRVLVKRVEPETKQGELYVPDSAQEKPQQGEVMAVGEGKRTNEEKRAGLDVTVGDRILFAKYSGAEFKEGGEEYLILREDEILGVIGRGTTRDVSGLPGGTGTDTD